MRSIFIGIAFCLSIIIGLSFFALKTIQSPKALAFQDPHSGPSYSADTDQCSMCHRVHTSQGDYLVFYQNETLLCFTCHDGSGSAGTPTSKQQFSSAYSHKINGVWSGSTMSCANCHESHRYISGGYKLVNPTSTTQSWQIAPVGSVSYDNSSSPSGLYRWCEKCHVSSTQTGVLLQVQTVPYVPYRVEIDWKTSRSPTSSPIPGVQEGSNFGGYWEYFSASHYNATGSLGEWHGRGSSSSINLTEPYASGPSPYPAMPCTDCHSHHGSSQPWVIKSAVSLTYSTINNYDMRTGGYEGQYNFCTACHRQTATCADYFSSTPSRCTDCHRHGNRF